MSEQEAKVAETEVEAKAEPTIEAAPILTPEDINQILGEKEKRIVDLESQLKGVRKLQSEADKEVRKLREQPQSSVNLQLQRDLISAMEAQQTTDEYGNVKGSPQLAQALSRAKAQVALLERQAKQQVAFQQIENEVQKIKREAEEAGIDPESKDFYPIVDMFKQHDILEAKRRYANLLKDHQDKKGRKEQKVGKTEEEIVAEVEKRVRAEFLSKYKVDVGAPSGNRSSFAKVEQDYAEGKVTYAEYALERKKQNI